MATAHMNSQWLGQNAQKSVQTQAKPKPCMEMGVRHEVPAVAKKLLEE